MTDEPTLRTAAFAELAPHELYAILRLRVDVFVVEQACAFGDLDGRDVEPDARHLWLEQDGRVVAYARVLRDPAATVIGRVVTPADCRRRGLGDRIMREALARTSGPVDIKAQSRLHDWYARFGFAVSGPEFLEDGIPHLPMRREP